MRYQSRSLVVYLGTELFSLQHKGVEVTQSEQYSLCPIGKMNDKRTVVTIWVEAETTGTPTGKRD